MNSKSKIKSNKLSNSSVDLDKKDYVERFEDMSPHGKLVLHLQPDGDLIVCLVPDPEDVRRRDYPPFGMSVEFCQEFAGGGQSPHTRKALQDLWKAIEKDNVENPQHRE